jgi:hypothetical protein
MNPIDPTRRRILLWLSGCGIAAGLGFRHFKTRPPTRCGIPAAYPYVAVLKPEPIVVTVQSQPSIPLAGTGDPAADGLRAARLFEFGDLPVIIDHCSLDDIHVRLHADGYYAVDFRADQNPLVPPGPPGVDSFTGRELPTKYTADLRRNKFFVVIRGLSLNGAVLFKIEPKPFWVQRQIPKFALMTPCCQGTCEPVQKYLAIVDRLELEFHYE